MIAVAGGGAQFLARGMARRPMGGVSTLETRERPVEGHVEGEEGGEGERGGAAAGRGSLMSVLCEYRTLFKVCVDTVANVCSHYPWYYLLTLYRGEGGGVSVEFSLILCSS